MRDIVLSSTANSIYQSCDWAYMLKYILGWRSEVEKPYFRIGGNWAKCQEIVASTPGELCWNCAAKREVDPDCYLCEGTGRVPTELTEAASRYLDYAYSEMPDGWDVTQWMTEKLTILYSFCAYKAKYPEQEYEVLVGEIPFSLPIIDPTNNRKLANCRLDGIVDQLWRHKETGRVYIGEQKSTSSGLEDGAYWDKLKLSGQVQIYSYAVWMLWCGGELEQYGLKASDATIVTPIYDVWHKPQIKPKFLTQGETKKFVKTSEYFGTQFEILDWDTADAGGAQRVTVNGVHAEVKPGIKEGEFAIRETPEMYAERLLFNITQRPDFYFARKEIPVNGDDISKLAQDCAKFVKKIKYNEKENLWIRNTRNCKSPGKCDFYDACYLYKDHLLVANDPPEGYRCYFEEKI
jgi:hypothetical protein